MFMLVYFFLSFVFHKLQYFYHPIVLKIRSYYVTWILQEDKEMSFTRKFEPAYNIYTPSSSPPSFAELSNYYSSFTSTKKMNNENDNENIESIEVATLLLNGKSKKCSQCNSQGHNKRTCLFELVLIKL